MNIKDPGMWPEGPVPPQSREAWVDLFQRRSTTFLAFCDLEREKGFLAPPASLTMPNGQEMARILMWRTVEEFSEAVDSIELDHRLEEIIDATNYLLALFSIDLNFSAEKSLLGVGYWQEYTDQFSRLVIGQGRETLVAADIGPLAYHLAKATEHFRNRAWMNQPQDLYYAGSFELSRAIFSSIRWMTSWFGDWETFWRFFVAKDNVLQFRIRSRY